MAGRFFTANHANHANPCFGRQYRRTRGSLQSGLLEQAGDFFYTCTMTIAARNIVFRVSIFMSLCLLVLGILAAPRCLAAAPELVRMALERPPGILRGLMERISPPVPWAPLATIGGSLLFALGGLILVLYYFEKTPAPEILYVGIFILSLSLEVARIMLPLSLEWNLPGLFGAIAQRILLFGRAAGTFSLFTAGICAAGLDSKRQGNILLVILLAGLVIALGMPVDMLAWDTSLCLKLGYGTMLLIAEAGIGIIAALSFVVSARIRGSREYMAAGAGALLAFIGRSVFLRADTWITPLPGLILLTGGTLLLCSRLHRIYLWL
jgi:hypothetical protein